MKLEPLEKNIGYIFKNKELLKLALTHSSADTVYNNERLEFLGDSTLTICIAIYLYINFPYLNEGELTRRRAYLVSKENLLKIYKNLKLDNYLIIGNSLKKNGGSSDCIKANVVESLIGAILLDSNIFMVQKIIVLWFKKHLKELDKNKKDYKTQLQEYLQQKRFKLPCYKIFYISGNKQKKIFFIKCNLKDFNHAKIIGIGFTKKKAEQEAAKHALYILGILS